MTLDDVLRELVADLPWGENVRLVVGELASREAVKDALLSRAGIVPAGMVCSLPELAKSILNKNKVSVDNSLSAASQCDAIESVASNAWFKKETPELCQHLKSRPVARKIARFLSELERSYVSDGELDAVVECLTERDPGRGRFVAGVVELWRSGALVPWGEGAALRAFLEWCEGRQPEGGKMPGLPATVWLYGFSTLTALEESVIGRLVALGVRVRVLVPDEARALFSPRFEAMGAECLALGNAADDARVLVWQPHSAWDEVEFLRDELERLRATGVAWSDIAVLAPDDDLYKRFVRAKLLRWNVPLRDPSLAGAWKDNPEWLWWRDLLRILATGLKPHDVRAWLGPGPRRAELAQAVYDSAVHGGGRQWTRLLEKHDVAELKLLVEAEGLFARAMRPADFLAACERVRARARELAPARAAGAEILVELGQQLAVARERPYLENYRARLPRYVQLFEEFLEARSRMESVRSDGVHFVSHKVWLPEPVGHVFVLGGNTLARSAPPADLWDWESVEARRIWSRVHFDLTFAEQARRDEAMLLYGLCPVSKGGTITYCATEYGVGGEPLARAALLNLLIGDAAPVIRGGHPSVGWLNAPARRPAGAAETVECPESAPAHSLENDVPPVRVTAFEDYLKCPFLYFGRHVLGLEPERELGLDADGRARGTVVHAVLEAVLSAELSGEIAPISAATRDGTRRTLATIVERETSRRPMTGMYRHKPLVAKARAVVLAHAYAWLDYEIANRAKFPALKPWAVERPIALQIGPYLVRGKADRIDSDGTHAVIVDYKTGTPPYRGADLLAGLGAQLLMYAQGIRLKDGLEPAAMSYLKIGRKTESVGGVFLKAHRGKLHAAAPNNKGLVDAPFNSVFETAESRWLAAAGRLAAGDFTPNPQKPETDCPRCAYKSVCGFERRDDGADAEGDDA